MAKPPGLLALSLAVLVLYVLHARDRANALFALSLFKVRSFWVGISGNLLSRLGGGAMPFLTPLMMQLGLGYSPSVAGMSLIPLTLAGMATKPFMAWLITRFGYRTVLSCNTFAQGVLIAMMALIGPDTHLVWTLLLLWLIGMANYIQYTTMGTVTLTDLSSAQASSGTSLVSVAIQLSIGLAVSLAGALLAVFNPQSAIDQAAVIHAFAWAYIALGALTMLATLLFICLPRKRNTLSNR